MSANLAGFTPSEQLLRLWWILNRWFTVSILLRDVFVPILELVRVGNTVWRVQLHHVAISGAMTSCS